MRVTVVMYSFEIYLVKKWVTMVSGFGAPPTDLYVEVYSDKTCGVFCGVLVSIHIGPWGDVGFGRWGHITSTDLPPTSLQCGKK